MSAYRRATREQEPDKAIGPVRGAKALAPDVARIKEDAAGKNVEERDDIWFQGACKLFERAKNESNLSADAVEAALRNDAKSDSWGFNNELSRPSNDVIPIARRAILSIGLSAADATKKGIDAVKKLAENPANRSTSGGLEWLTEDDAEPVHWLWEGYIPYGMASLLMGDPGTGKSTLLCDLIARATKGVDMPPSKGSGVSEPAKVLLLSSEDSKTKTIIPRLVTAGANVSRVAVMTDVTDYDERAGKPEKRPLSLPRDLPLVEQLIQESGITIVIVDPLVAYLDGRVDSHNDKAIRVALAPLNAMAERTGAAIIGVLHLNKDRGGKNPLYRGNGSIGIVGNARSVLILFHDRGDEKRMRRFLACAKINLAAPAQTWLWELEEVGKHCRVNWLQTDCRTADELCSAEVEPDGKQEEAEKSLLETLRDGPRKSAEALDILRAQVEVGERTIKTARKHLGIKAEKIGIEWWMCLPEHHEELKQLKKSLRIDTAAEDAVAMPGQREVNTPSS